MVGVLSLWEAVRRRRMRERRDNLALILRDKGFTCAYPLSPREREYVNEHGVMVTLFPDASWVASDEHGRIFASASGGNAALRLKSVVKGE